MPYPLQWGAPTFDAGNAFAIMSAAFASLVEVSLLLVDLDIYVHQYNFKRNCLP